MIIGLASKSFINGDIQNNINVIIQTIKEAQDIDLLCFGEAFLQGFDALSWDYQLDQYIAFEDTSAYINQLQKVCKKENIAIGFGFLEKDKDKIYSSYLIIDQNGKIVCKYRRISKGWKEYRKTDDHYLEGNTISTFTFHNQKIAIALCGDLWDYPEKFHNIICDILLWPVYINYSIGEWEKTEKKAYCEHVHLINHKVLMVNSLSTSPLAYGGCYYYVNGEIDKSLDMGNEGILKINIR